MPNLILAYFSKQVQSLPSSRILSTGRQWEHNLLQKIFCCTKVMKKLSTVKRLSALLILIFLKRKAGQGKDIE